MLAWALPAGLLVLMGYAMQRGSICALGAVFEMVQARRSERLAGLAEAALWSLAVLGVAAAIGVPVTWPAFDGAPARTLLGGALIGVGAVVNRACVMGTVARLGAGEGSYLWTPVGFFAACLVANKVGLLSQFQPGSTGPSTVRTSAAVVAAIAVCVLTIRRVRRWLACCVRRFPTRTDWASVKAGAVVFPPVAQDPRVPAGTVCLDTVAEVSVRPPLRVSPRAAVIVIAVSSAALKLLDAQTTLSRALQAAATGADVSHVRSWMWVLGILCPILGAVAGGLTSGTWRLCVPSVGGQIRCFLGGSFMGFGATLGVGGNDQLILQGVPNLNASAWLATISMFVTMFLAIVVGLRRNPR